MPADGSTAGLGCIAGGQTCPECDETLGIADVYCRWCGTQLREPALGDGDPTPEPSRPRPSFFEFLAALVGTDERESG